MAEEQDLIESGMTLISSDSKMEDDRVTVTPGELRPGAVLGSGVSADMSMKQNRSILFSENIGAPPSFPRITGVTVRPEELRPGPAFGSAMSADMSMKQNRPIFFPDNIGAPSIFPGNTGASSIFGNIGAPSIFPGNTGAPSIFGNIGAPSIFGNIGAPSTHGLTTDAEMSTGKGVLDGSALSKHELHAPPDEDVEHERLMDRLMYMQATQGHVDGFKRILDSISSEKQLEPSDILCQVSPQNDTCLHIAVSFGHHELAKYIVGVCPDLIEKTNSKGDTALHIAARRRDLSFIKFVMDPCPSASGASPDVEKADLSLLRIVNREENTVLHEALINHCKEAEVVEILIKKDPQVAYYPNKEGKSPLYLAAEAHYFHVVEAIQKSKVEERMKNRNSKGKPAVHGAILGKNKEMLEEILAMEPVHQTYEDGSTTPLHFAASVGYLEGVQKLLGQSNFDRYQRDSHGFCPIHVASIRGYVDIVKELLQFSPDSQELLSKDGKNFLHLAAMCGKDNVLNFVLKKEGLEKLINEKDRDGNTPLHLATKWGNPKVVSALTWDKRVDVNLVNNQGQTAFDIALSVGHPPSFHQRLIWTAIKSAGAQPPRESKVSPSGCPKPSNPPDTKDFKDRANTLLLVSTLIVTVTFAAGFTMPGDVDSSGMATMLMRSTFHAFVIWDTIAMYTSILAAIILIWAQLGDLNLMVSALEWALTFLGLALTSMSLAFMSGVYLVISNLHWLAIVVLIIGMICIISILVPFFLLFLPSESTNCILRYVSYYSLPILIWASGPKIKRED